MDTHNPILEAADRMAASARKAGYLSGIIHSLLAIAAICVLVLIMGCTTIDTHTAPPADWPQLKQRTVYVESAWGPCRKYAGWGTIPFACAEIRFDLGTCVIYTTSDRHLKHEELHCRGFDHHGDTTLADAWAAWKGRK